MFDFFRELLSLHNLPCTALLGLVMMYWLLVILGFLDADIDGVDTVDGGGGHDSHAPGGSHSHSASTGAAAGGGGLTNRRSKIFSFGAAPLNIVGTVLAIVMWVFSILGNFYFNGTPGNRSLFLALVLLVPNLLLSLAITRILIIPFDKLFASLQGTATESEIIIGREGRVVSTQVDEHYGQVEISSKGAPLLLNARVLPGVPVVTKGALVTITAHAEGGSYYFVVPVTSPAEPTNAPT